MNCAREVQALAERSPELRLRIGIHLGDVLFTSNTVLGDGVNVASRIHALTPPGGVCISATVYDEIRNKPGTQAKDLGRRRLKNVSRPIRVYRLLETESIALPSRGRAAPVRAMLIAAVLVLAGLALWVGRTRLRLVGWGTHTGARESAIRSIAVLPLENLSGDPAQEYFADGMTEELITDLAKISALRVISRTSVMQFKGEHRKRLPEIARMLDVDAVVEGSVLRLGDKVRITAQLIDAPGDKHLWADSYERDTRDVLAMQDEVAFAIARQVNVELTPQEQQHLTASRPVNPAAYEAYLKGHYYLSTLTDEGEEKARKYLQQSIDADPSFAPGYAGLSEYYSTTSQFFLSPDDAMPKAKELARKALELDPSLAEAHKALAMVKHLYDFDWTDAEAEFRRGIALSPGDADIHNLYGMMLQLQGRFAEAHIEKVKARQLNPLSPVLIVSAAISALYLGQLDSALKYCRQAAELSPDFAPNHVCFGATYALMGKRDEAMGEYGKFIAAEPLSAWASAGVGPDYVRFGDREGALKLIDRLNAAAQEHRTHISPCGAATIYAALGDKPRALDMFEKCYQERSAMIVSIKTDQNLNSLRGEPRFIELLKKIGMDDPADDYFYQGWDVLNQATQESNLRARGLFEAALALQPKHALAHFGLGSTFWYAWNVQWESNPESLEKALGLGRQAVGLNAIFPGGWLLAYGYSSKGQYEQAEHEARRAIDTFPGFAESHAIYAQVLNYAGRPAEAIKESKRATELDVRDQHLDVIGWSGSLLGRYKESIEAEKQFFVQAHGPSPLLHNPLLPHLVLAFDYAQLRHMDSARKEVKEILRISPRYTTDGMRRQAPYKDRNETERWIAALRNAGLR